MSLLLGAMKEFIPGRKQLTEHEKPVSLFCEKEVYIPLVAGNNTDFTVFVNEGDHVSVGTKLACTNSGFYVPIYSSVSGVYKGQVKRMHSSLKPQMHMVIEADGKQERVQSFAPLDYTKSTRQECVDFVKEAGIVGLGGAGFPAYVKYGKVDGIDTVLVNAVECEPYITADYQSIFSDVESLLTGCLIAKKMAEASRVLICIKESHPDLIDYVKKAIKPEHAGIEVCPVKDKYPMGWERVLVREVMHKEYENLPGEAGCIVNNANTLMAIAHAFTKGEAITQKCVTISGEGIKEPKNVLVPVGLCVAEIIKACGGCTSDTVRLIAGGPMMGKTIVNDQFVIDRATNAITILKDEPDNAIACLRCGRCSDHCPSGLQPVRIAMALKANDVAEMEKRQALKCIECGLCTYICPSKIDVTENVRKVKRILMMKKKK